jgi:hypothetical protein
MAWSGNSNKKRLAYRKIQLRQALTHKINSLKEAPTLLQKKFKSFPKPFIGVSLALILQEDNNAGQVTIFLGLSL